MAKVSAALFIIAVAAVLMWPGFHGAAMPQDEGTVLVYPELMLKGALPYRDFETVTGPGNPLLLAATYRVFGTSIFVERAVGLVYRLLLVIAIFAMTQRWGSIIALGSTITAAILLPTTDLWANTWFAGVGFALLGLWAATDQPSTARSLGAGILAGVSVLCRCDFALVLGLAVLPLFWSMPPRAKLAFVFGGVAGLVPLICLTTMLGPAQMFYSLFVFPVLKLNPGRHLSLTAASPELYLAFGFYVIASALNLTAAVVETRTAHARGRVLLAMAILGFGFVHYALERFDDSHVLNAAIVSVALLPLSIFVLLRGVAKSLPFWATSLSAIAVTFVAIALFLPNATREYWQRWRANNGVTFIRHNGRAFPLPAPQLAASADKILTDLEKYSVAGERFFVGPGDMRLTNYCDTYMYYLEPRLRPATYHLEMNPGSANAPNSRLPRDIASADWVLLNRRWDYMTESNRSIQFGPDTPNETVRHNFDLCREQDEYLLFRNRRLRNSLTMPPND